MRNNKDHFRSAKDEMIEHFLEKLWEEETGDRSIYAKKDLETRK